MESSDVFELCPVCTQCGQRNTCVNLDDHYTFSQCEFYQLDAKATNAGLTLIHASTRVGKQTFPYEDHRQVRESLAAIVCSKINHMTIERSPEDKSSSFMAVWGPTWLAQALKNYNRQQGYAGLSLSQYLDMVKP